MVRLRMLQLWGCAASVLGRCQRWQNSEMGARNLPEFVRDLKELFRSAEGIMKRRTRNEGGTVE